MTEPTESHQNADDDYAVSVVATIEGHPESVLRDMLASRANTKRSVQLIIEIRKPPYRGYEPHWLPKIVNGDTNDAQDHLRMLFRQGFLTVKAETRISSLIDSFGRATR
jgi:hypothetical protein